MYIFGRHFVFKMHTIDKIILSFFEKTIDKRIKNDIFEV